MPKEYLKDQLWKLFEKLPEELKELIFAAETAENIDNVCRRNNVTEDKMAEVAKSTGRVLMGLLPPSDFESVLLKEAKLRSDTAKNVAREINRFIFFPVKEILSQLYETEIAPPARPKEAVELEEKEKPAPQAEERIPRRLDTYRETIE